jgi:oligogalacturonide lyase
MLGLAESGNPTFLLRWQLRPAGGRPPTPIRLLMPSPFSWPRSAGLLLLSLVLAASASAQIGQRFPSERKVVIDPVTGVPLTFLTSTPGGDSKIYPTHRQWTSDGKWLVFRSNRVPGQALAVNEQTGDLVQVTGGAGYMGMLTLAYESMTLYIMRDPTRQPGQGRPEPGQPQGPREIVAIDLAKVFADSAAGTMKGDSHYERVVGTIPAEMGAGGDMAVDASEDAIYFRFGREYALKHMPPGMQPESNFGPRNMGAGPTGIARMDTKTGEIRIVTVVPFQAGHVQTNPYVPGEIVFSWETGGNAPTRAWYVRADGTGLRPVYDESKYDWVTHEAIISKDEVALAIMGHRPVGTDDAWGPAGSRQFATGLAIINLRTQQFYLAGQTKTGSGLWHVHGSPDGRWAVGDDFSRSLYLIDRRNNEMMLLTTGHKDTAADHPHPTFSPDGTRIQIQSAMLSEDGRSMNICIVPVPEAWLKRKYGPPEPQGGRP